MPRPHRLRCAPALPRPDTGAKHGDGGTNAGEPPGCRVSLSSLSLPAANAVGASVARVVAVPTSDRNSRRVVWGVRACETCMDSAGRFISAPFPLKANGCSPRWPSGGGGPRTHKHPRRSADQRGRRDVLPASEGSRRTPRVMRMRRSDRGRDLSRSSTVCQATRQRPSLRFVNGYGYESSMSPDPRQSRLTAESPISRDHTRWVPLSQRPLASVPLHGPNDQGRSQAGARPGTAAGGGAEFGSAGAAARRRDRGGARRPALGSAHRYSCCPPWLQCSHDGMGAAPER